MTNAIDLGSDERRRLAEFADCLIAGGLGLPSASAADLHGLWIDRALRVRPDLLPLVRDMLAEEGPPSDVLARVREADPARFSGFAFAIAGAYLINPRVREVLGFPGPVPVKNPAFPDEAEAYLEDGILEPVIARGPIYRPTPQG